jgi:uncharacterized protein
MAAKFELFQDKRGEYRWRLRHQNGQVIADSGESYTTKAAAINGIESVKKNVAQANIKDLNEPEVKPERSPAASIVEPQPVPAAPVAKPEPTPIQPEERKSLASFEVYQDKAGEYRWRLRHQNGNVIADSGEGYKTKESALNGIKSVVETAPDAPVEEQTG